MFSTLKTRGYLQKILTKIREIGKYIYIYLSKDILAEQEGDA